MLINILFSFFPHIADAAGMLPDPVCQRSCRSIHLTVRAGKSSTS